eukprot:CCRYP_014076-RA/>CCRYP_014076-RA protein AED:0.00 eAED:0.00 QI:231/1/1/1/0/0/3/273/117
MIPLGNALFQSTIDYYLAVPACISLSTLSSASLFRDSKNTANSCPVIPASLSPSSIPSPDNNIIHSDPYETHRGGRCAGLEGAGSEFSHSLSCLQDKEVFCKCASISVTTIEFCRDS